MIDMTSQYFRYNLIFYPLSIVRFDSDAPYCTKSTDTQVMKPKSYDFIEFHVNKRYRILLNSTM